MTNQLLAELEILQQAKDKLQNDYQNAVDKINNLQQENKQLKEQLENDIDRYEDTISYQLGFDKGKEYMQQRIDKAIEYIRSNAWAKDYEISNCRTHLLEILGGKDGKIN